LDVGDNAAAQNRVLDKLVEQFEDWCELLTKEILVLSDRNQELVDNLNSINFTLARVFS